MQGLGDQRESGVGYDGAGTGQVGKESIERRLLIKDVPFFALAAETVGNEAAADRTHNFAKAGAGEVT